MSNDRECLLKIRRVARLDNIFLGSADDRKIKKRKEKRQILPGGEYRFPGGTKRVSLNKQKRDNGQEANSKKGGGIHPVDMRREKRMRVSI